MAQLTAELERLRQKEEAAALDAGESAIAAQINRLYPLAAAPAGDSLLHWYRFANWCEQVSVRVCPAKPASVAAFIEAHAGLMPEILLATLAAIEEWHDGAGLANPVATMQARIALGVAVHIDAPRSWKTAEKVSFAQLPPDIQHAIERREREREKHLRSRQNELAALEKSLRQTSGADQSAQTKEDDHGEKEIRGRGQPGGTAAGAVL